MIDASSDDIVIVVGDRQKVALTEAIKIYDILNFSFPCKKMITAIYMHS
jgi:hypothetical protein